MTILGAHSWPSNAELIADVAQLGYIGELVLDATYGKGTWWKLYQPDVLVTNDINPDTATMYHFDFREMDFGNDTFDTVAFDPPYVCKGGRATSGIQEFDGRYGLRDTPRTPADLQFLIEDGLQECARVTRPGGTILVKCMDYITSGKLMPATYLTQRYAQYIGLTIEDRFVHVGRPGPQPAGRRQVHARRNHSDLFVFRKGQS